MVVRKLFDGVVSFERGPADVRAKPAPQNRAVAHPGVKYRLEVDRYIVQDVLQPAVGPLPEEA